MTKPDISKAINDTGLSLEQITQHLKDSIEIRYGSFVLKVERRAVDDARQEVAAMSPEERPLVMASVERALHRNIPKLQARKYTKKRCDDTMGDLVLWHVLTTNT